MKTAKALKEHLYRGKRRRVGDTYPIAKTDYPLMVKLGKIEIVQGEQTKDYYIEPREGYRTTAMEPEPEPVKKKRPYRRKKLLDPTDE